MAFFDRGKIRGERGKMNGWRNGCGGIAVEWSRDMETTATNYCVSGASQSNSNAYYILDTF